MTVSIREAYEVWKRAAATRSECGELRATREEREALERFVAVLDAASEGERGEWETLRSLLDAGESRCGCGHPLAHHDDAGSCFHVSGCATGCACGR
jgi:hypothetical protein